MCTMVLRVYYRYAHVTCIAMLEYVLEYVPWYHGIGTGRHSTNLHLWLVGRFLGLVYTGKGSAVKLHSFGS
jgi:hypothetical protein